jgi:hypothetical protein
MFSKEPTSPIGVRGEQPHDVERRDGDVEGVSANW